MRIIKKFAMVCQQTPVLLDLFRSLLHPALLQSSATGLEKQAKYPKRISTTLAISLASRQFRKQPWCKSCNRHYVKRILRISSLGDMGIFPDQHNAQVLFKFLSIIMLIANQLNHFWFIKEGRHRKNKQYSVPKLKKIATSIPLRSTDAGQKEERNRTGNPSLVNCTCCKDDQMRRLLSISSQYESKRKSLVSFKGSI